MVLVLVQVLVVLVVLVDLRSHVMVPKQTVFHTSRRCWLVCWGIVWLRSLVVVFCQNCSYWGVSLLLLLLAARTLRASVLGLVTVSLSVGTRGVVFIIRLGCSVFGYGSFLLLHKLCFDLLPGGIYVGLVCRLSSQRETTNHA